MSKSYDFPASELIEKADEKRLQDIWTHLTLLASGQTPETSNAEAAQIMSDVYYNLTGKNILPVEGDD